MYQSMSKIGLTISKTLQNRIKVNPPWLELLNPNHYDGSCKQFNLTVDSDELFSDESINALINKIIENAIDNKVKFGQLTLPKNGVKFAGTCIVENVVFRYLEAHEVATDRILKRIDVLLVK